MENTSRIPFPYSDDQERELRDAHRSGILPENATTPALAASLIVKQFAGKLFGLSVSNTNAAAQYILVFDSGRLPDDGTVPLIAFKVDALDGRAIYFGSTSRSFEQGIVVCNSSTQATKTIGSADCLFDAQYI